MKSNMILFAFLAIFLAIHVQAKYNPKDWQGVGGAPQLMYVDPKTMDDYDLDDDPTPAPTSVTPKTGPTLFDKMVATMASQPVATNSSLPWMPTHVPYAPASVRGIPGWQTRWGHGPVVAAPMPTVIQSDQPLVEPTVIPAPVAPRRALMPLPNGEDRERLGPVHFPGLAPLPNRGIDSSTKAARPKTTRQDDTSAVGVNIAVDVAIAEIRIVAPPHKSFAEDRNSSATSPVTASNGTQSPGAWTSTHKSYGEDRNTSATSPVRVFNATNIDTSHPDARDPHHGPIEIHSANTALLLSPACPSTRVHPRDLCKRKISWQNGGASSINNSGQPMGKAQTFRTGATRKEIFGFIILGVVKHIVSSIGNFGGYWTVQAYHAIKDKLASGG